MPETPLFHYHRPLAGQARRRAAALMTGALAAMALGAWLMPQGAFLALDWSRLGTALMTLLAHFLLIAGALSLVTEATRYLMNRNRPGAWDIRLTAERLTWDVPRHFYGRETAFDLPLTEIARLEERVIEAADGPDTLEFWLYPATGKPIRLREHSGISLVAFAHAAERAGIPFERR